MTDETFPSLNDRTTSVALAILQIVTDAETEPDLPPGELQCRIWRRLRDEFDDIARQAAEEQETSMSEREMPTYDMGPVSAVPDLRGMKFDDAVDAVVEWFFTNFEDPVESTPYETAEGGYIYIWGGPCDAREEIETAFVSIDEKVTDAAVERIELDRYEWAPSQSRMVEERAIGSKSGK